MKPTEAEIQALGEELLELGKKLFHIACRLRDTYTEERRTCAHDVPLLRESCIAGIPVDQALQITVSCPKCGACSSVSGHIPKDDDYFRRNFGRPPS